ncbi:chalcone isomerase family protein, partial [Candidatus Pseudothioglobus singularis]
IEYQGSTMIKNGQGTRIIFFMKVYEGSLYLEMKSANAQDIINLDAPMAIRIDVSSQMVTADAMKKALSEGLEKSTGNNTDSIMKEINQLSSSFDTAVSTGDYYEFIYLPELGTHVLKNSELVELIKGINFKKAFFGIFLSDNPVQKNLKKAMLGG